MKITKTLIESSVRGVSSSIILKRRDLIIWSRYTIVGNRLAEEVVIERRKAVRSENKFVEKK